MTTELKPYMEVDSELCGDRLEVRMVADEE